MFEIILLIMASLVIGRVAAADGKSGWMWGILNVLVCFACLFIPIPFVRIGIGSVGTFMGMIVFNALMDK